MADTPPVPSEQAAQLQEAIDTLAQAFDYPPSLKIHYSVADGTKRTTFEFETGSEQVELIYDGGDEKAEPTLTRIE